MSDRASMTSQQAKAVVSWLDGTDSEPSPSRPPAALGKGKGIWRPYQPEKSPLMLHRLPYPTFDAKAFSRVVSLNLCSAIFGFNIVIGTVIRNSPRGVSVLDVDLNWIISLPIACLVFAWETWRFLLAWRRPWDYRDLRLDVAMEAFLGVVAAICSILAAFQTAQHRAYNARYPNKDPKYNDVWLEMGLAIMLGFLSISCFAVMALALMEFLRSQRGTLLTRRQKEKGKGIETVV